MANLKRRAALRVLGGTSALLPFLRPGEERAPALYHGGEVETLADPASNDEAMRLSNLGNSVIYRTIHADGVGCDPWLASLRSVSPAIKYMIQESLEDARRPLHQRIMDTIQW